MDKGVGKASGMVPTVNVAMFAADHLDPQGDRGGAEAPNPDNPIRPLHLSAPAMNQQRR